jgi:hypothetical protein
MSSGASSSTSSGQQAPAPLVDQRDAVIMQLQQQMQQVQQHMHQQATAQAQQLAAAQAAAAAAAGAAPRPSMPKLAPLTRFSGAMSAVNPFVRGLVQHHEYYNMATDASKLQYAVGNLEGGALTWLNSLPQRPATWDEFVRLLNLRFRPLEENLTARIKLGSLKQGKNSVGAYTNIFQTVLAGIDDMGVADQVHHYMFGLNPPILQRVLEKRPATLPAVIELAASVEASQGLLGRAMGQSHYGARFGAGASSSSESVPMDLNNIAHEEQDEESDAAPRFHDEPAPRSVESVLVAKLEAMEHRLAALQNFSAPKTFNKSNDRVSGLKSGDISRLMKEGKCFRCQKSGHMKRDCPQGGGASSSSKPKSGNY